MKCIRSFDLSPRRAIVLRDNGLWAKRRDGEEDRDQEQKLEGEPYGEYQY